MMRKILGPPGTGKTTKLLKYVKTFLKLGTPLDKIGYFAFTKKAANEAPIFGDLSRNSNEKISKNIFKNNIKNA